MIKMCVGHLTCFEPHLKLSHLTSYSTRLTHSERYYLRVFMYVNWYEFMFTYFGLVFFYCLRWSKSMMFIVLIVCYSRLSRHFLLLKYANMQILAYISNLLPLSITLFVNIVCAYVCKIKAKNRAILIMSFLNIKIFHALHYTGTLVWRR